LVVDGYDPRIHRLYFCPQLYKQDEDHKLVALQGEEIGGLVARALEGNVESRAPWYEPSEKWPADPIITGDIVRDLDSLVVDKSPKKPVLS
jgi:hypothetical protein